MQYYSLGAHVDTQVYFDAGGGSWYRTSAYASGWGAWQRYVTDGGTWGINITGTSASISGFNNPTTSATANTIVYRDGVGDVAAREFVLTASTIHTTTPSSIVGIFPTTNQVVKFGDTAVRAYLNVPTRTGGDASGTWAISITGASGTTRFVESPDGSRNPNTFALPTTNPRSVRYDFSGAGFVTGATGNYAGVMTYSPWDGTSASTGDSSYQLAFCNWSGINASGLPGLALRNGINSSWNGTWYQFLHSGNYSSYALPIAGGTMTGAITTPTGTSIYIGGQNVSTSARLIINWHTDSDYQYLIGKRAGGWTQPMDVAFYTGLRYHAHLTYNGHIFYVTGYDGTEAFSIGKGDANVRVVNNLYAAAFFETSDKRLKELVQDNYSVKGIHLIKPKLYIKNGKEEVGYYAQDFQEILPVAIATELNGYLNLSYTQVHTVKIAHLEDSVEEIKAKILYLENQLKQKQ